MSFWRSRSDFEMQQRCNGCGIEVGNKFHFDHIVPKSRGGSEDPINFQILCPKCNLSKGTLTMEEWVRVPNARCREHWWWRLDQAPLGLGSDKVLISSRIARRISTIPVILDFVVDSEYASTLIYPILKDKISKGKSRRLRRKKSAFEAGRAKRL